MDVGASPEEREDARELATDSIGTSPQPCAELTPRVRGGFWVGEESANNSDREPEPPSGVFEVLRTPSHSYGRSTFAWSTQRANRLNAASCSSASCSSPPSWGTCIPGLRIAA